VGNQWKKDCYPYRFLDCGAIVWKMLYPLFYKGRDSMAAPPIICLWTVVCLAKTQGEC